MPFDRYELWDTHTLLGVYRETDPIPSYWLDLLFQNVMTFDDEYIDFEKILASVASWRRSSCRSRRAGQSSRKVVFWRVSSRPISSRATR